jgi:hypothetical protein
LKEHQVLEEAYFAKGKAFFQLRKALANAGILSPDAIESFIDDPVGREDEIECEKKSEEGNRKQPKARFGRRRTHNEQLVVRPCGIILSRATFYGSEGIAAVAVSLMDYYSDILHWSHKIQTFIERTFPTPQAMPEYLIFDNGCHLHSHVHASHRLLWSGTATPVDVFHCENKHSKKDTYCQTHCNPAGYPELVGSDGKWVFNTSVAEQTNAWFGGFIAIVRDMEVVRYNFFLDEMIKRRNRYTVGVLKERGLKPWLISEDAVFPPM